MAGWAAYTAALVGTKNISQAAIVGFDGVTWASSDAKGFVVSQAEAKNIVAAFKDPSNLRSVVCSSLVSSTSPSAVMTP